MFTWSEFSDISPLVVPTDLRRDSWTIQQPCERAYRAPGIACPNTKHPRLARVLESRVSDKIVPPANCSRPFPSACPEILWRSKPTARSPSSESPALGPGPATKGRCAGAMDSWHRAPDKMCRDDGIRSKAFASASTSMDRPTAPDDLAAEAGDRKSVV